MKHTKWQDLVIGLEGTVRLALDESSLYWVNSTTNTIRTKYKPVPLPQGRHSVGEEQGQGEAQTHQGHPVGEGVVLGGALAHHFAARSYPSGWRRDSRGSGFRWSRAAA